MKLRLIIGFLAIWSFNMSIVAENPARKISEAIAMLDEYMKGDQYRAQPSEMRQAVIKQRETLLSFRNKLALGTAEYRNVQKSALDMAREFKSSRAYGMLNETERARIDAIVASVKMYGLQNLPPSLLDGDSGRQAEKVPEIGCNWRSEPPPGLQRGDIVMVCCDSILRDCFYRLSQKEKRFTHGAIVVSCGQETEIITTDAGDGFSAGFAKTLPWADFCSDANDLAVFRYEDRDAGKIASAAMKLAGTPFDVSFDLNTSERLYCMEFLQKAVNQGLGRKAVGTSRVGDFIYVAPDDAYFGKTIKVFDARESR